MAKKVASVQPNSDANDPLAQKVARSLHRYGYTRISVHHIGDRIVRLSGPTETADDRALAIAIARTVPGVVGVSFQ